MDVVFLISAKLCARHIKGHTMTQRFQLAFFFSARTADGGFNGARRGGRPRPTAGEISATFLFEKKTDKDKESLGEAWCGKLACCPVAAYLKEQQWTVKVQNIYFTCPSCWESADKTLERRRRSKRGLEGDWTKPSAGHAGNSARSVFCRYKKKLVSAPCSLGGLWWSMATWSLQFCFLVDVAAVRGWTQLMFCQ